MPIAGKPIAINGCNFIALPELAAIFGYTNIQSLRNSIRENRFPIPTFRLGGRVFADPEVVREYFKRLQDQGMSEIVARKKRQLRGIRPS